METLEYNLQCGAQTRTVTRRTLLDAFGVHGFTADIYDESAVRVRTVRSEEGDRLAIGNAIDYAVSKHGWVELRPAKGFSVPEGIDIPEGHEYTIESVEDI